MGEIDMRANKSIQLLSLISITLFGLLISIASIRYTLDITILLGGIAILLLPIIITIVHYHNISKTREVTTFGIIFVSIFFMHYLFYWKYDIIVGTDAPFHYLSTIELLDASGKFDFSKLGQLSFQFPLMYVLYNMLSSLTTLSTNQLAIGIHPAINILSIIFFYLILRHAYDIKFALIVALLLGWEYTTFFYGFEYRTESFAIVLFIELLYLIFRQSGNKVILSNRVLYLIISFSIIMSHFVTSIHSIIVLSILSLITLIKEKITLTINFRTINLLTIFVISFIAYMMFISKSFGSIMDFIIHLIIETFQHDELSNIGGGSLYGANHGYVVFTSIWLSRLAFVLGTIFFINNRLKKKSFKLFELFIVLWSFTYSALLIVSIISNFSMSPERIYHFFSFPFVFFAGYFIYIMSKNLHGYKKIIIIVMVFLICTYPLLVMPSWIVDSNNKNQNEFHFEYTDVDIAAANFAKIKSDNVPFIGDQRTGFIFTGFGRKLVETPPYLKTPFKKINATIFNNLTHPYYVEIRTDDKNFVKYSTTEFQNYKKIYDNADIQIHLIS